MLENPFRGGGEVGIAGANPDHQVSLFRQQVSGQRSGLAHAAQVQRMIGNQRAFARLRLCERDLIAFGELPQRLARFGVLHPAAADNHRLALTGDQRQGIRQLCCHRQAAIQTVNPFLEEIVGIVPGFALYILRQR